MTGYEPIKTTRPSEIKLDPNYRSKILKLTEKQQYRLLEMVPGILVWFTFAAALGLSFIKPLWAIYFIIVFDLLWLIRIVYLTSHVIFSWFKFHRNIKIDWFKKLKEDKTNYTDYHHVIFYPTAGEPLEILDNTFASLSKNNYSCY